jgi:predicted RNA-binding Zn-ribbon protein involved in translation (DUF1610 family)
MQESVKAEKMVCQRCKVEMKILRRTYHKQRKWVCPKCGRAKLERTVPVRRLKSRGE